MGDTSIGEAGVRALARAGRLRRLDLHENDGVLASAAAALHSLADTLVSLDVQSCPVRIIAQPAAARQAFGRIGSPVP